MNPIISDARRKKEFIAIKDLSCEQKYLEADDYDALVRMLGVNTPLVEFDIPLPFMANNPVLVQQFSAMQESLRNIGDRMSDGFDRQSASDRLGDRLSGSLNDMKSAVTDMKYSINQLVQLLTPVLTQKTAVTEVGHSPLGDPESRDSPKETTTQEVTEQEVEHGSEHSSVHAVTNTSSVQTFPVQTQSTGYSTYSKCPYEYFSVTNSTHEHSDTH